MIDPITLQRLNEIQLKERLEQAEKNRWMKELAVSDNSILKYLSATVSGWAQRMKSEPRPAANARITGEYKRATAETPGV